MNIRKIELKDNQTIKKIIQDSLERLALALPGTAYFDPQLDNLTAFYQQNRETAYWIAEENGQVLGGCGIGVFDRERNICELQKLYLLPEAQGKGIARKLVLEALQFAEKYYDFCYLETMAQMKSANRLYQSFGFELLNNPLAGSEHGLMDRWYLKRLKENAKL